MSRTSIVAVLLAVALGGGLAAAAPRTGPPGGGGDSGGQGVCDVTGVRASFDVRFRSDLGPAGYRVERVRIGDLDGACVGATVHVALRETATSAPVATGSFAPVSGAAAAIALATPPLAERVDHVSVTVAGGATPVPPPCAAMAFDQLQIGTEGDDTIERGQGRLLSYGLGGNDRIVGANMADCLDGGAGDDVLDGNNQNDVLLGGDGDDVLVGGNGNRDVCIGGSGTDTIDPTCETRVP